jgi:simple sugar transport system ATP-binding protein
MTDAAALEVQKLSKAYGPVRALSDVNLTLKRGQVLGLLGDNGAGKSTLVKCICGNETPDEGAFLMNGEPVRIDSPQAARTLGIETVHQDLALVPALNVAENLFLNRELVAGRSVLKSVGWLRKRQMYAQSRQILNERQRSAAPAERRASGLAACRGVHAHRSGTVGIATGPGVR